MLHTQRQMVHLLWFLTDLNQNDPGLTLAWPPQWIPELGDFVREVVGGRPSVLVGNSLGGYASLATAAKYPELIRCAGEMRSMPTGCSGDV